MIKVTYNKEENIVHSVRTGEVGLDELFGSMLQIEKDCRQMSSLYILGDVRESFSKFNDQDYPVILTKVKEFVKGKDEVRHALLVDKPLETAFGLLYEQVSSEIVNYTAKTFSTIEAAQAWLKLGEFYHV